MIPQPRRCTMLDGAVNIPNRPAIGIPAHDWLAAAQALQNALPHATIHAAARKVGYDIRFVNDTRQPAEGYRLIIAAGGITLAAATARGAFWGAQTLRQIIAQAKDGRLPCLEIVDVPDFPDRAYYYDIARGRVPHHERLVELIDLLAAHKINQLQLYIEHTFAFRGHPKIGQGANPLTAEDILALDAHAGAQFVELVPSLATFGHLSPVLTHPEYHHLAEDNGTGDYRNTDEMPAFARNFKLKGWSLAPANPECYQFLDSLFAEFLPLFHSPRFNVCCDETWDLGCGQSYDLVKKIGHGELYLRHLLKLYELCGKYNKQMMCWGDILRKYPALLKRLPGDVVLLDWGYSYNHNLASIQDFKKAGFSFMACPSTSSYVSFFPRIPQSRANVSGFAAAAKKAGAQGILNTEWGDGGHYNFLECSWPEILFGAEQSWNTAAQDKDYSPRFMRLFLNMPEDKCAAAARVCDRLGEISFLAADGYYQSVLRHVFFAPPTDKLFSGSELKITEVINGKISVHPGTLDAARGKALVKELDGIVKSIAGWRKISGADPHQTLAYWEFAAECLRFAARKLSVLTGRADTPAARRQLVREQKSLLVKFQRLWLARNHKSEIMITVKNYRRAIRALEK